jgi:hypothetical protein
MSIGRTFRGDGLYVGDGGHLLERLWRMDPDVVAEITARSRNPPSSKTITHQADGGAPVTDDVWPGCVPWLPLRKCDGRYSLGQVWARKLCHVEPEVIAAAVDAAAGMCNTTLDGGAAVHGALCSDCVFCVRSVDARATLDGDAPSESEHTASAFETTAVIGRFGWGVVVDLANTKRPNADPMRVVRFADGGGLLSYRKPDGRYVHTFNTESGLCRKVLGVGGTDAVAEMVLALKAWQESTCNTAPRDAASSASHSHFSHAGHADRGDGDDGDDRLPPHNGPPAHVLFAVCCNVLSFIDDAHGERTRLAPTVVITLCACLANAWRSSHSTLSDAQFR